MWQERTSLLRKQGSLGTVDKIHYTLFAGGMDHCILGKLLSTPNKINTYLSKFMEFILLIIVTELKRTTILRCWRFHLGRGPGRILDLDVKSCVMIKLDQIVKLSFSIKLSIIINLINIKKNILLYLPICTVNVIISTQLQNWQLAHTEIFTH